MHEQQKRAVEQQKRAEEHQTNAEEQANYTKICKLGHKSNTHLKREADMRKSIGEQTNRK